MIEKDSGKKLSLRMQIPPEVPKPGLAFVIDKVRYKIIETKREEIGDNKYSYSCVVKVFPESMEV